jgi:hypothetical protein
MDSEGHAFFYEDVNLNSRGLRKGPLTLSEGVAHGSGRHRSLQPHPGTGNLPMYWGNENPRINPVLEFSQHKRLFSLSCGPVPPLRVLEVICQGGFCQLFAGIMLGHLFNSRRLIFGHHLQNILCFFRMKLVPGKLFYNI